MDAYFVHEDRALTDADFRTHAFNPRLAWWLAECSRLAYEPKDTVIAALRRAHFGGIRFFDTGGSQAFFARHSGAGLDGKSATPVFAVLAFRGTEKNYADILTDANLFPSMAQDEWGSDHAEAHGGFVAALELVWGTEWPGRPADVDWVGAPGISNVLAKLDSGGMPFCITGHSLGGALATLAASRHPEAILYTFGSPRVAGTALAERLNGRIAKNRFRAFRLVHSLDIVPRVPFPLGFRHVGSVRFLSAIPGLRRHFWGGRGEWLVRMLDVLSVFLVLMLPASLGFQAFGWLLNRLTPPGQRPPWPIRALLFLPRMLVWPFQAHQIARYRDRLAGRRWPGFTDDDAEAGAPSGR